MNWFVRHKRLVGLLCFIAVCYGLLAVLQARLDRVRQGVLTPAHVKPVDRLLELGFTVMLGSLRTIPVDYLWVRATRLKERREHIELYGVIRAILRFQPTDIEAYDFQIWNMAYNIQHDAPSVVEGWGWIEDAIKLAEEGIERNRNHPDVWRLYHKLGSVYMHRCASVGGQRTDYFREKVTEKEGEHPYLVAAEIFRQAFEEATRPDAGHANPHHLSMWAYAYAGMARELEQPGENGKRDLRAMLRYRQKAIDAHQAIAEKFPRYREQADKQIAELRELMRLHRAMIAARDALEDERLQQAKARLLSVTNAWAKLLEDDPLSEEAGRNLDDSIDALAQVRDQLARQVDDLGTPEEKEAARAEIERLTRRILSLRYAAAGPKRRSARAAARLEEAVASLDRTLNRISRADYLANADLVRRSASIWVRILSNPVLRRPGDSKADVAAREKRQAERAAAAVLRFHGLVTEMLNRQAPAVVSLWETATTGDPLIPEQMIACARALDKTISAAAAERQPRTDARELGANLNWLGSHCLTLVDTGLVDSRPLRRVVAVRALIFEQHVAEASAMIVRALQGRLRPGQERSRAAVRQALMAAAGSEALIDNTVSHWTALLRNESSFKEEAALAERHLAEVAALLEQQAAAHAGLFPSDSNVFLAYARRAWQALYEYDPGNEGYSQKRDAIGQKVR
ncbi:MAG: hypothetical protein R6V58_16115 [Planctomycetota bacterium]